MSGGHFCYQQYKTTAMFGGEWRDHEINELFDDLFGVTPGSINLVKELDYWMTGDSCEEHYRDAVAKFKRKWLGASDVDRLRRYRELLQADCDRLKAELAGSIGGSA